METGHRIAERIRAWLGWNNVQENIKERETNAQIQAPSYDQLNVQHQSNVQHQQLEDVTQRNIVGIVLDDDRKTSFVFHTVTQETAACTNAPIRPQRLPDTVEFLLVTFT